MAATWERCLRAEIFLPPHYATVAVARDYLQHRVLLHAVVFVIVVAVTHAVQRYFCLPEEMGGDLVMYVLVDVVVVAVLSSYVAGAADEWGMKMCYVVAGTRGAVLNDARRSRALTFSKKIKSTFKNMTLSGACECLKID